MRVGGGVLMGRSLQVVVATSTDATDQKTNYLYLIRCPLRMGIPSLKPSFLQTKLEGTTSQPRLY